MSDTIPFPEIDTVAKANTVTVVMYVRNSSGGRSIHELATVGIAYPRD